VESELSVGAGATDAIEGIVKAGSVSAPKQNDRRFNILFLSRPSLH
jgi:hypothetical protein